MKTFHANQVSVSEAGEDCFQVLFEEGSDDSGQYLLVQREFETPDGGACYVEDDALVMTGHFRVRGSELGRACFSTEFAGPSNDSLRITFAIREDDFA